MRTMRRRPALVLLGLLVLLGANLALNRTAFQAQDASQALLAARLGGEPADYATRSASITSAPFSQRASFEINAPDGALRVSLARSGPWSDWTLNELTWIE